MHAVNAGIGGDQVQHVHWRLQNGLIKECKPQVKNNFDRRLNKHQINILSGDRSAGDFLTKSDFE